MTLPLPKTKAPSTPYGAKFDTSQLPYPSGEPFNGPPELGSALYDRRWFPKLLDAADTLGVKPEDLIVVLGSETGLNPALTAGKPYRGLNTIGWYPDVQGVQGTSAIMTKEEWDSLPTLSPTDSLEFTRRYFLRNLDLVGRDRYRNALDLYLSNASYTTWVTPALEPLSEISGYNTPKGYEENKGMDTDRDGKITVVDLKQFLQNARGRWAWMIQKLRDYQMIAGMTFDPSYKPVAYTGQTTDDTSVDQDLAEINQENAKRKPSRTMQTFERTGNSVWPFYGVVGGLGALVIYGLTRR